MKRKKKARHKREAKINLWHTNESNLPICTCHMSDQKFLAAHIHTYIYIINSIQRTSKAKQTLGNMLQFLMVLTCNHFLQGALQKSE